MAGIAAAANPIRKIMNEDIILISLAFVAVACVGVVFIKQIYDFRKGRGDKW